MTHLRESPSDPVGEPIDEVRSLAAQLAGRDHFISVIGHELRNAVAPMLLLSDQIRALASDPAAPAPLESRAVLLSRHLGKLVATIERVAEVAELRRGTLQIERSQVDLAEVVAEACHDARREADAGGVTLSVMASTPVHGDWDRLRIKQIVDNLVSNAIRYGGGGRVELSVIDRGTAGELIVRDHGAGLAPEVLPRLFDPFGPLGPFGPAAAPDPVALRRTGGFGIGLWVVKTLCTAMQGSVTAENDPSGGARFSVVLPRG